MVIGMLRELSEDLNSIKKIQSEMKDTLIEIKKTPALAGVAQWIECQPVY